MDPAVSSGPREDSPASFRRSARRGLVILAFLVLLLGTIALAMLRGSVSEARLALYEAEDIVAFGQFQSSINGKLIGFRGYLLDRDDNALHAIVASRADAVAALNRVMARADASEKPVLEAILRAEEEHQKALAAAVALRRSGADPATLRDAFDRTRPARDRMLAASGLWFDRSAATLRAREARSRVRGALSFGALLAIAVAVFVVSLVYSLRLTRRFGALYEAERAERIRAESGATAART